MYRSGGVTAAMGIDSQNAEKAPVKTTQGDNLSGKDAGKHLELNGATVLTGGDAAARNYGKSAQLGDLPTNADLLKQIDLDEKNKVYGFDRKPFSQEREIAKTLNPEEVKAVGDLVGAIKNGKTGVAGANGTADNAGDIIKQFQHDPLRLTAMKDMIQLELERQHLDKKFQVDVKDYTEATGKPAAVVVISKTKNHSAVGIMSDGKKAPNELLNFIYD